MHLAVGNKKEAAQIGRKIAYVVSDRFESNGFDFKAIAVYRNLLNIDPENIEIRNRLAQLYIDHGLKKEAEILLREDSLGRDVKGDKQKKRQISTT
jgi:hypothetical protein